MNNEFVVSIDKLLTAYTFMCEGTEHVPSPGELGELREVFENLCNTPETKEVVENVLATTVIQFIGNLDNNEEMQKEVTMIHTGLKRLDED